MLRCVLLSLVTGAVFLGSISRSEATVVDFDDLAISSSTSGVNLPANYAGINWDSNVRYFSESANPGISEPKSGENFAYNQGSAGTLGFSIIDPVLSVESAWFTQFGDAPADQVRFVGRNASNVVVATSAWLTLSETPQILFAIDTTSSLAFGPVFRIEIERTPLTVESNTARFSMDDLTIVPEPLTLSLLAMGAFSTLRRKRTLLR